MKIVVTGSLGNIGRPLAEELIRKGHAVTVVSNSPQKQQEIEALGATAAIGSVEDAAFLAKALSGADAVFAMVPPNFTTSDPIGLYSVIAKNYAQAVQQAGVKRVVLLSSYGAHLNKDTGYLLAAHYAEEILNTVPDISLTHIRAGFFYYNLLPFANMVKHQGIMGAVYGGNDRLPLVHPSDIAAAVAEELTATDTGRKVRYVVSDERTASEVASVLGSAIGKPDLQWLTFPREQAQAAMEHHMPAHIAKILVDLGSSIHSGIALEDYDLHKPSTMGKIKLEEYAPVFANHYLTL